MGLKGNICVKQGVNHSVLWKRFGHTETTNTLGQEAWGEQPPASAPWPLLSPGLCAAEAPVWNPLPPPLYLALSFTFGLLFRLPGTLPVWSNHTTLPQVFVFGCSVWQVGS